jgi:PleD family two-component response regulator
MKANVEALGNDIGIPIGLSIGIANVDPDMTVDRIIAIADEGMYDRKTTRRRARKTARTA